MMNVLVLSVLFVTAHLACCKPFPDGMQGLRERTKRQQIAVPRTHLVKGKVETKEGIVIVNKHASPEKKFNVLHVPVMEDKKGIPFEVTAKESGTSYLTGPALRILNKDNKYDERNPFIFFPLLKSEHSQGKR